VRAEQPRAGARKAFDEARRLTTWHYHCHVQRADSRRLGHLRVTIRGQQEGTGTVTTQASGLSEPLSATTQLQVLPKKP
jgi:hypothetical protein